MNLERLKFRAKTTDGSWLYGIPHKTPLGNWMMRDKQEAGRYIDPDTIGQWTGLNDKNGKEIYEGDIIHLNDEEFELEHGNGIVVFLDKDLGGRPCGGMWYVEDADEDSRTDNSLYDLYQCGQLEIIGNIFDNKNLLEQ